MFRQSYLLVAILPFAFVAGCADKDTDFVIAGRTASVRFVNATDLPISVANLGVVASGNSGLVFGGSAACLTVDASNANALTFTNNSTGATITGFAPSFSPGGNATVVAFTDANGNTQFATLNNTFTPTSGQSGLRVFNAANGSGTLSIMGNGTALGVSVPFGTASDFVSVPSGMEDLTFTNGSAIVLDAGNIAFVPGLNRTVVVGPALSGSTTLRSFTANGC
jgi:acyl dehydratase